MKPYINQIIHYNDLYSGKIVAARICELIYDDEASSGKTPFAKLERLDNRKTVWSSYYNSMRDCYRFIRDPNEMLLAAKDYKGVVIVRSDDPEDTIRHAKSIWKGSYTSTSGIHGILKWINNETPIFICPDDEADAVRALDATNFNGIKKPIYIFLKRGGKGLRVIETEGLFPNSPICDPDEAAQLTPDEYKERRQQFFDKAGMTPEQYRKEADLCKDLRLSHETAFLAEDVEKHNNTNETITTNSLHHNMNIGKVFTISNQTFISDVTGHDLQVNETFTQDGVRWKVTDHASSVWAIEPVGKHSKIPTEGKAYPYEIKNARWLDECDLVRRDESILPKDIKDNDVFRQYINNKEYYYRVIEVQPEYIVFRRMNDKLHGMQSGPIERIKKFDIQIKSVHEVGKYFLAHIKGIHINLIEHIKIYQNGIRFYPVKPIRGIFASYEEEQKMDIFVKFNRNNPELSPGPAQAEF